MAGQRVRMAISKRADAHRISTAGAAFECHTQVVRRVLTAVGAANTLVTPRVGETIATWNWPWAAFQGP